MRLVRSTNCLLLGFVFMGLLGCNEKTVSLQPQSVPQTKESKPGAAIKLVSSSILFVTANEVVETELLFDSSDTTGELYLELSSPKELDLLSTIVRVNVDLNQPKPVRVPVKFRALQNGRFYLNIHASINTGESLSSRNLAVIVQVGEDLGASSNRKTSPQLEKTSGEQVISMPAQETISSN